MNKILKKIVTRREFFLFITIMAVVIFAGVRTEYFLTVNNLKGLLLTISVNSIIASGMTVLFISKGFDLSVGSVFATLGVILGILLKSGVPVALSIIIILLLGIGIGSSIGFFVAKVKMSPFIVTLAYYFSFLGLAYVIGFASPLKQGMGSPSFSDFPESFTSIAGGTLWNVEYIVYYTAAIIILFHFLTTKNVFFRQNFYLGGEEQSARTAGIKVNLLKIFNYSLVSLMVAIATILRASRVGATGSQLGGGPTYSLIIITAVILGGASLEGGSGSILGSLLGVVLIALLYNVMVMFGVTVFYNELFIGAILFVALLADNLTKKYNARKITMSN